MSQSKRRAFTLIELLVVVAIIGILAAILFPVFARAREDARRASCLSNLKQIGLGLMMYTQDYDEFTPDYSKWMKVLQPYVKSGELFVCPSAVTTSAVGKDGCDPANRDTRNNFWGSYGVNGYYVTKVSLAAFMNVSKTIYLAESTGKVLVRYIYPTHQWGKDYNSQCGDGSTAYTGKDGWATWHFGGNDILFADGHVKWMKMETIQDYNGDGLLDNGWFCLTKSSCYGQSTPGGSFGTKNLGE